MRQHPKPRILAALIGLLMLASAPSMHAEAVLPRPTALRYPGRRVLAMAGIALVAVSLIVLSVALHAPLVLGMAAMAPQEVNLERIRSLGGARTPAQADRVVMESIRSREDFIHQYRLPDGSPATLANARRFRQAVRGSGTLGDVDWLRQADFTSAIAGLVNPIFGRFTWPQVTINSNSYLALPKSQRSSASPFGWRAKTAFASSGKGGQSEGTIPAAVTGSYTEVSPSAKEHSTQMRVSGLMQALRSIQDNAMSSVEELRVDIAIEHAREIERALQTDVDTLAGNNIESIDRATASSANQAAIGWTAGHEDIFGISRSANTWFNAIQDASATARALTTTLVDGIFRQSISRGGHPTFWLTGYDTWESLADLYQGRGRFEMGVENLKTNGKQEDAEALEGLAVTTFIGRLHGRVIVGSDLVTADANELSRLYLLDTSNPEGADKPRFGIDIIEATQVYVAGEKSTRMPQAISFAGDSVLMLTRHELGMRNSRVQAQLRDCTAP